MATKTYANTQAPKFDMPKFDFDAVVSMQKANLDAMMQVRGVLADAAQSIAKLQYNFVQDSLSQWQGAMKGDVAHKKPEDFYAEAKAVTEKAVSIGKEQAEIGAKAQQEVTDLVTKRVQQNFEDAKSLAA